MFLLRMVAAKNSRNRRVAALAGVGDGRRDHHAGRGRDGPVRRLDRLGADEFAHGQACNITSFMLHDLSLRQPPVFCVSLTG